MNMTTSLRCPLLHLPAWASGLALALLAACGGGGVGSGGTGRSDGGFAAGTVNGFGSVIVDGVSYDDRSATVVSETSPGHDAIAELKLGHRVAVDYPAPGVAGVVRVDAAVTGPVASAGPGGLTVLGQTIAVNMSGAAGPITQLGGGYSAMTDIRVGDAVDVHGIVVPQGSSYAIQATRIDKLAAAPSFLRATGVVGALTAAGSRTFTLAQLTVDASAAAVVPTGTTLANGQTVTILAAASSLSSPTAGASKIQAAQVKVRELQPTVLDTYLSGSVSRLDTQARTFVIDGRSVGYAAATISPASASLGYGLYVQARGVVGADGTLQAAAVVIRDAGSNSEAELRGDISALDTVTASFIVRGVTVDSTAASLSGCPASGLANGLFVEIHGATISTGVRASTIECQNESSGSTVEREGTASAVDQTARSFKLTPEGGAAITVTWSDTTYFGRVTAATLAGKSVQVEGALVSGNLVARKITVDD
jgi:hypothetical protein